MEPVLLSLCKALEMEIATQVKLAKFFSLSLGTGLIFMGSYNLGSAYWLGEWFNIELGKELLLPKIVKHIAVAVLLSGIGIVCLQAWGYFLLYVTSITILIIALPVVPFLPFSTALTQPLIALGMNKTMAVWILNFSCVATLAASHYILWGASVLENPISKRSIKRFAIVLGTAGVLMVLRGLLLLQIAIGGNAYSIMFLQIFVLPLMVGGVLGIGIAYWLVKR